MTGVPPLWAFQFLCHAQSHTGKQKVKIGSLLLWQQNNKTGEHQE
jgi:hypothetical protein